MESAEVYTRLDRHVDKASNKLNIVAGAEQERLHFLLRDFSTQLQIVGRVSSLFIGGFFQERYSAGSKRIEELVHLATYGSRNKFFLLNIPDLLKNDFISV